MVLPHYWPVGTGQASISSNSACGSCWPQHWNQRSWEQARVLEACLGAFVFGKRARKSWWGDLDPCPQSDGSQERLLLQQLPPPLVVQRPALTCTRWSFAQRVDLPLHRPWQFWYSGDTLPALLCYKCCGNILKYLSYFLSGVLDDLPLGFGGGLIHTIKLQQGPWALPFDDIMRNNETLHHHVTCF